MSDMGSRAFDPRVVVGLILTGIVAIAAFTLLVTFGPDLQSGNNGGTHALSRSATGYSGLYDLAEAAGMHPTMLRRDSQQQPLGEHEDLGLLVLTPPPDTPAMEVVERIGDYAGPVLVVLPKYRTMALPLRRGWVQPFARLLGPSPSVPTEHWGVEAVVSPLSIARDTPIRLDFDDGGSMAARAPADMVQLTGEGLFPMASVDGHMLIGSPKGYANIYLLADPDFLNNRAMANAAHAGAALALLRRLNEGNDRLTFDLTLSGIGGGGRSVLRLALTPPFLGLTLCLVAAALLALWQGFVRFGPPWREVRAVAMGKAALVANGARLIVQARRLPHFAPRYAALVRDAAARRLHAPTGISGVALDRWLDRFVDRSGRRYSDLAGDLSRATTADTLVQRAAALNQWRRDVTRESE